MFVSPFIHRHTLREGFNHGRMPRIFLDEAQNNGSGSVKFHGVKTFLNAAHAVDNNVHASRSDLIF